MDIEVFFDPVFHIVINNMFEPEVNKKIMDEILSNENEFKGATLASGIVEKYRNNTVAYYDMIYNKNRYDSELLKAIDSSFINPLITDMLASSPYPISEFPLTNYHETQVSRYGDDNQRYIWHIDRLGNSQRQLTLVYYANIEPKKYSGGELQLTNSPIYEDKTVIDKPEVKTITPKNNMGIIFGATTAHMVLPTKSSDKFEDGRFSVNCWIGRK